VCHKRPLLRRISEDIKQVHFVWKCACFCSIARSKIYVSGTNRFWNEAPSSEFLGRSEKKALEAQACLEPSLRNENNDGGAELVYRGGRF